MGTEFVIYDNGEKPEDSIKSKRPLRKELVGVLFEASINDDTTGPRRMRVIIPDIKENGN